MVRGVQTKASEQQKETTPTEVLGGLVSEVLLSKAASLARKGEYAAAEGLLKHLIGNENADALDLLAKIFAQQGRFSEAETFWKSALQVAPNNESYIAGLKRLAQMQSRSLWAGVLLSIGAALIGILVVFLFGFIVRDQIIKLRDSLIMEVAQVNPAAPPIQQSEDVIVGSTQERPAEITAGLKKNAETETGVPSGSQIRIQLSGAAVKTQKNSIIVLFNEGLFLSRANLKTESKTILSELAKQLQPHASNISIRIVGQTDTIPVTESSAYRDNAALGMARAFAVADYLSRYAGLPLGLFLLQSAGQSHPPYPNDTLAGRLRNRTVIINIYPIDNCEGEKP